MFNILLVLHCLLCFVLVVLVLLQQGKGADMGAAFGGNSSTLFGASGAADFITKLTTSIAIAFMVTSIMLVRAYENASISPRSISNPLEGSVMDVDAPPVVPVPAEQAAPETAGEEAPPQDGAAQAPVASEGAAAANSSAEIQGEAGTASEPSANEGEPTVP